MNESRVKQAVAEWSKIIDEKEIPYAVIGSAAMVLHKCPSVRKTFKDIDFLIPEERREELQEMLKDRGFGQDKHKNFVKDGVTIGIATPKTHHGSPNPTDDSNVTQIDGVRVLKLAGLIETKMLAVESQMKRIVNRGYRRGREKSATKHLGDFFLLCRVLDERKTKSG